MEPADGAKLQALSRKAGFDLRADEVPRLASRVARMAAGPVPDLAAALALARTPPFAGGAGKGACRYTVGGTVRPGFEGVRAAFERNFARGLERDAQLAVYHRGTLVVDLWGSSAEPGVSRAPAGGYDGDTLQQVWSSTKMMEATAMAVAADRGWFRYTDKVTKYWPEYAQGGQAKAEHTIADILRHDTGLHALDETLTPADVEAQADPAGRASRLLARQPAWTWPDGPDAGKTPRIYHGTTRGFLLNQVLVRTDPKRRTIGQLLADEIAGPLGADFFCGPTPAGWERRPRGLLTAPSPAWALANQLVPAAAQAVVAKRAAEGPRKPSKYHPAARTSNPLRHNVGAKDGAVRFHDPGVTWEENGETHRVTGSTDPFLPAQSPRAAVLDAPSCSGRASARGMARIMAAWANGGALDGVRVVSPGGVAAALAGVVRNLERNHEAALAHPDWASATLDTAFSQGGVNAGHLALAAQRNPRFAAALRRVYGEEQWGWGGFGGSALWFNRIDNIGFGYTVTGGNAGVMSGEDDRTTPLLRAVQAAVSAAAKL